MMPTPRALIGSSPVSSWLLSERVKRDRTASRRESTRRNGAAGRLPSLTCLAVVLLCSTGVGCRSEPPAGPLEPPTGEAPYENYSGFREVVGHTFTFGLIFIRNYGSEAAVLDDVELVGSTGGIELVDALAADITGDRRTWSSDEDFTPIHPDGQRPLEGFRVLPGEAQDVQILLGVQLTENGQHGFRSVAIQYQVRSEEYRYTFPSGVVVCSPSFYESSGRKCDPATLFGS